MSVGLSKIISRYKDRLSKAVEKGNNDEQFSCLMFALQLPSICARLDFPRDEYEEFYSGKNISDKKLYIAWLKKNRRLLMAGSSGFLTFNEFCLAVYELRCSLVHEGILSSNKELQNIRFLSGKHSEMTLGFLSLGAKQYIPLYYLCDRLFIGALKSVSIVEVYTNESDRFSLFSIRYTDKVAITDKASLVVDYSELSDEIADARKRAEEFLGKKSKRECALFFLYHYLSHYQLSVFDDMESHFASKRRHEKFSREIDYYGAIDEWLETLDKFGKHCIFRAKDGNQHTYRFSVDAGVYREMKKIVREFEQFIQRGKAL